MEEKKAGRPLKEFDTELFEQLCGIMCTEDEICGIFHTTDKTLNRWLQRTYEMDFSEAFKRFSAKGKMNLRRWQFNLAKKNAGMAIFLGKNYLGQRDMLEYTDEDALEKLDEILEGIRSNEPYNPER